jgi:hypothetical protein
MVYASFSRTRLLGAFLCAALFAAPVIASDSTKNPCGIADCCRCVETPSISGAQDPAMRGMPGMQGMAGMQSGDMARMNHPVTFIDEILDHSSAGTSGEPISTPHDMLMTQKGAWMIMFHGGGFLNAQQQSGPRGADKVFGTSWLMPMAQRTLGPGTLTARGMFSLEPATITNEQFPELFQIGETAHGKPIVDGQHPHNLFMELALLYDIRLGANTLLSFYAAPIGDPAMGPEAFPHRASASEDPLAPLGHHLQDSTHIAEGVVTAGLTYKIARLEVSGYHGREPGENRWTIETGTLDSWSTRLTLNPSANWSGQYSISRLTSPEQLFPQEDTLRMTASVAYNRPLRNGNWATLLLWGRNRDIPDGQVFNSYLAESTVRFAKHNFAWTRIENVDRSNELLLGENPLPPNFEERFLARVQAYSFGYDREFNFVPHVASALGAQYTLYAKPASLDSLYGAHPMGVVMFLRLRAVPLSK